jgi:hypothetical protein
MFAAQDTIAKVYRAGIAVITITIFRDILAPRDWITGIDGAGNFVVTIRCMHTISSIVGVRGASDTIITACQDVNAISFIAVIEGGCIFVVAILRSMHACFSIEGIDGTPIAIVAFVTMPGRECLIREFD